MRGSLRLGRLWGIDLYVHWTFALLIGYVVYSAMSAGGNALDAALSVVLILAVFACVVLHEYGHALTARRYGVPTRDITLLPIGGVARLERMPDDPKQELLIALAGPAVNVVIAAILTGVVWGLYGELTLDSIFANPFIGELLAINVLLVAFNVLPAFPMDGGRVLRALLAMRMNYVRATRAAAAVGQGMALLFGVLAILNPQTFLMLGLIGIFVFLAARSEAKSVQIRAMLKGLRVRDAMLTDFHVLAEGDPLWKAADLLLAGSQQDFPVLSHNHLRGLLRRDDLMNGLRDAGTEAPVGEFVWPDMEIVDEQEPLDEVVQRLQSHGETTVPVLHDGELVGLLTAENVTETLMLRAAVHHPDDTNAPPLPHDPRHDDEISEQEKGRDEWRHHIGDPPVSAGR